MLDKLKALGDAAKGVLLWIIAPVLAVVAYVLFLKSKNAQLKEEIQNANQDQVIKRDTEAVASAESAAASALEQYKQSRAEYLKAGGSLPEGPK